jgi:hypothetical protein
MSKRRSFSNEVQDRLIRNTNWVSDVPMGFQARYLPGVTPTAESRDGRGAPIWDIFCQERGGVVRALGLKIGQGKPSSHGTVSVTTGTMAHCEAILNAAFSGTPMRQVCYLWDKEACQWWVTEFDLSEIAAIRVAYAAKGQGNRSGDKSGVLICNATRSYTSKKSGQETVYEYTSLTVNAAANGVAFRKIADLHDYDWQANAPWYVYG